MIAFPVAWEISMMWKELDIFSSACERLESQYLTNVLSNMVKCLCVQRMVLYESVKLLIQLCLKKKKSTLVAKAKIVYYMASYSTHYIWKKKKTSSKSRFDHVSPGFPSIFINSSYSTGFKYSYIHLSQENLCSSRLELSHLCIFST